MAALVQEVVARDDWQAGNSIALVITGRGKRVAGSFRGRDSAAAKLIVDADEAASAPETSEPDQPYRVRLYFGVPSTLASKKRIFDVSIQGETVLKNITLGGVSQPDQGAQVHTIDRVMLGDTLDIGFVPKEGAHATVRC